MKALFLVFHGFAEHNGITKKIHAQVAAMRACGVDTVLSYTDFDERGNQLRMCDERVVHNCGSGPAAKVRKRIQFTPIYDYVISEGIGMVYMRSNHNASPFLTSLLRKLRKAGVKVVMEIPTYPYDHEYKGTPALYHSRLYVDRAFRRAMARELFRIVTFSEETEIFGRPTIRISNGIDFDGIPQKRHVGGDPAALNLIGVAEIHYWHGFDRVVAGLAHYYSTPRDVRVVFHVVGDGFDGQAEQLRAQAEASGVSRHVVFHGRQTGEALDGLFEMADMGVASLGRHRSRITHIKTLKNREYAARGIPFVYSEIDTDFEGRPYVLKAPADETSLDIARVVEFYRTTPRDPAAIRASIEGTLSWKAQMQKVIDTIENEE